MKIELEEKLKKLGYTIIMTLFHKPKDVIITIDETWDEMLTKHPVMHNERT